MLVKLHSVSFCAVPTVATMDMGLEFEYVSSEGAGSVLGAFGEWPAIMLRPIPSEQWKAILEKVKDEKLTLYDLAGTDLEKLAIDIKKYHEDQFNDLSDTFSGLLTLADEITAPFYCLYDLRAWDDSAEFFQVESDLHNAFYERYCWDEISWDDMDDDELEEWNERINEEFQTFPLITYEERNE